MIIMWPKQSRNKRFITGRYSFFRITRVKIILTTPYVMNWHSSTNASLPDYDTAYLRYNWVHWYHVLVNLNSYQTFLCNVTNAFDQGQILT